MDSQNNSRWIKGEDGLVMKFDIKPGTDNVQQKVASLESKDYQGSSTTGITSPGNNAKSESHDPQKREPGKLPIPLAFTADVSALSNGGRPNEPVNNERHETSSVAHPTKMEKLTPYEKYKAKLKVYKAMFESNSDKMQGVPNYAQYYLPNETGVKESARKYNDDTTTRFQKPQSTDDIQSESTASKKDRSIVNCKPAAATSEDTYRQTPTQHDKEDASEHSQNSFKSGSDTNQDERKYGHNAEQNQKEKAESTSRNGNGTRLDNKRGYVDDSNNSEISKQNSESEAAAKAQVDETRSSSEAIVSETMPQTPTPRSVKSNKDHGGNKQNHASGNKGDHKNREVSSTVKEKKIPEMISRDPGQKFELQSMHVAETIGIQGFNNSCYMDSSLVSLFLCDTHKSFSEFIQKSRTTGNEKHSLNEKIRTEFNNLIQLLVNDDTDTSKLTSAKNKFRSKMSKIHESYSGDEKDVEEFMSTLFGPVLDCSPFYRIAGEDDGGYVFQTYGLPDNKYLGEFPSVQHLVNYSFSDSEILLEEVPHPGFIIKLPVTNGRHMFPRVFPNLMLSLKEIVGNTRGAGSLQMLLSAVICLRSNHYTAFVRIDPDDINSSWAYLDSFQHSQYTIITNLNELLQGQRQEYNEKDELMKLLFENAYVCVYSPVK